MDIAAEIAAAGLEKWESEGHSVPRFLDIENGVGTIPMATDITIENAGDNSAVLVNGNLEGYEIEAGATMYLGRKGINSKLKIIANTTKVKIVYYG